MSNTLLHPKAEAPCLALRPRQAAKALGISERLLWSMTNRGEIPHVRMGRAVVYPVDGLNRWLSEQAQKKGGRNRRIVPAGPNRMRWRSTRGAPTGALREDIPVASGERGAL